MVAKAFKREFLGVDVYIRRLRKCIKNDSDFIYLYGWKKININFVKKIIGDIEKLKLGTKISESVFPAFIAGKRTRAICVRIKVPKEFVDEYDESE